MVFGMTSGYGGVESFIMNYYRHIDRTQLQFDFLVYNREPAYADEIRKLGGRIFVIPGRKKNPFACKKNIMRILSQTPYCAVWSNLCYMSDIIALQCAKRIGVPRRIIHAHNSVNMSGKINGWLHNRNRTRIFRIATDFWACSKAAGEYFYPVSILESDRFQVIPNAIEVDRYAFNKEIRVQKRQEMGLQGQLVVGNVGRLHFQKNQKFLLDIFAQLHKRRPNSTLLIAGEGELRPELEQKIEELQLKDSVRLLGNRSDIAELMQAMDVFVLPSLFEGLGIVLIEAQAAGLPCFASADVIPVEAKVSFLLHFISLKEKPAVWADNILHASVSGRVETATEEVKQKGYDIRQMASRLQKEFLI